MPSLSTSEGIFLLYPAIRAAKVLSRKDKLFIVSILHKIAFDVPMAARLAEQVLEFEFEPPTIMQCRAAESPFENRTVACAAKCRVECLIPTIQSSMTSLEGLGKSVNALKLYDSERLENMVDRQSEEGSRLSEKFLTRECKGDSDGMTEMNKLSDDRESGPATPIGEAIPGVGSDHPECNRVSDHEALPLNNSRSSECISLEETMSGWFELLSMSDEAGVQTDLHVQFPFNPSETRLMSIIIKFADQIYDELDRLEDSGFALGLDILPRNLPLFDSAYERIFSGSPLQCISLTQVKEGEKCCGFNTRLLTEWMPQS